MICNFLVATYNRGGGFRWRLGARRFRPTRRRAGSRDSPPRTRAGNKTVRNHLASKNQFYLHRSQLI